MTKYTRVEQKREERPWKVHPIWRGIGCAMLLLIVVMAYVGAKALVDYNQVHRQYSVPDFVYKTLYFENVKYIPYFKQNDVINPILTKIKYGYIIFMLIFMFIGFGTYSFLYAALYRSAGGRYRGRFDAPYVPRTTRRR
jgi:ABC-type siderophore export system fused ATPase/permease subunit